MAAEQSRLQHPIWVSCCIQILDLKRTETLCNTNYRIFGIEAALLAPFALHNASAG